MSTRDPRRGRLREQAGPPPREMSYLRIVAQGLVPATWAATPAQAVARQLAIQGQQVSAVPHAIVSRCRPQATRATVDAAFESGELVRSWPMRGTVHITAAADHHWLRVALMHRMDAWERRSERELGVDAAVVARAEQVAVAALDEHGALSRAALLAAWEEAGLMGPFSGPDVESYRRRLLLVRLQREGVLVQGPRRGNEHLVISAAGLPGAHTGPGGASGGGRGSDGHRACLCEIARRYATSHGPVTAADLSRWTTLPVTEAARALEDAVEATNDSTYAGDAATARVGLTRAVAEGGARGSVRLLGAGGGGAPLRRRSEILYMRADLPDLLAESRRRAEATYFLASFDELHVGYKDRSCLTDRAGERLICPSMNGMFRPLLVDRGRVVAVRPVGKGLVWAEGARRSARLERDVARAVKRMEERLAPVEAGEAPVL